MKDLIREVFKATIELSKEARMLNLSSIAIDGSKYKANASY
jgi:transposase